MVPARGEAFVLDAKFLGAVLFQRVERHMVEHREVFGCVAGANAGFVLVDADIEHPVEAVFIAQ